MNCIEFEYAAEYATAMREPLPEAVLAHARACSHCQRIWALNHQLDEIISAWRQTPPPVGLVDAVLAKLADPTFASEPQDLSDLRSEPLVVRHRHESAPVRRSNRTQAVAVVSMASCLFVAMTGLLYLFSETDHSGNRLTRSAAAPVAIEVTTDASYDVSNKLVGVLTGIRSEYHEIASETSSAARDLVTSIPLRVAESVLPATEEFEMIPDGNNVKQIFQPIGKRVGRAFGFLLEAVPSEIPAG